MFGAARIWGVVNRVADPSDYARKIIACDFAISVSNADPTANDVYLNVLHPIESTKGAFNACRARRTVHPANLKVANKPLSTD